MNNDQLLNMQAIANILHSVLTVYPEAELIETFKLQDFSANWPRLTNSMDEEEGMNDLVGYLNQWNNEQEALIHLKLDYGKLFFGPGTPVAAPWGSVYLNPTALLNDASTIQLKQFYAKHNIKLEMDSNEPLDHIGLITAVLAFLFGKLIDNAEDSELKAIIVELLAEHLLPWADRCLELAYINAETDYYKGFAALARAYFKFVGAYFNVQPKQLAIYL